MNPNSTPPEGLYGPVAPPGGESRDRDVDATNGPQAGVQGAGSSEAELHARRAHPDWEYATTEGPRKHWDDIDVRPAGDDGEPDPTWQRNTDAGIDGWERFDYTEESYWRRPKQTASEAGEEQALVDQIATAIYEWSCQPHKWASAHPHDVLAYRADAHAVMAAVVRPLQVRAKIAEGKAREVEGATDIAVRAVQLMQQAGAERDAATARLAAFVDQVQAIADEARGGIRQQLGDALAALEDAKETP